MPRSHKPRRRFTKNQRELAKSKLPVEYDEFVLGDKVYSMQPLIVTSGPYKGRICENDDDDVVTDNSPELSAILENYQVDDYVRIIKETCDGKVVTQYAGLPCQIVYFGSTISVITLACEGGVLVPNFALRPANTNDMVERMDAISREIFDYVGADKSDADLFWHEAFSLQSEKNFILSELWETEILLRANVKMKNIFLCHSSKDKPSVRRVAADLTRLGHKIWLDEFEILPGDSIVEKISEGTARADALVLFVSSSSNRSQWVSREWQSTLSRKLGSGSVRIIPVLLEKCDLPVIMSDIKYADFSESYDIGINALTAALSSNPGSQQPAH